MSSIHMQMRRPVFPRRAFATLLLSILFLILRALVR